MCIRDSYNPAWRKGKEAFFATDGSDRSMIVMFAPEGCVINGVDSELYDLSLIHI